MGDIIPSYNIDKWLRGSIARSTLEAKEVQIFCRLA